MNTKGVTFIELMIILVILGILATLAIPKFIDAKNNPKKTEEQIQKEKIEKARAKFKTIKIPSYTEFKKTYTVLMIDKKDTLATISKDKEGNIWKLRHTTKKDWTVQSRELLGYVEKTFDCPTETETEVYYDY